MRALTLWVVICLGAAFLPELRAADEGWQVGVAKAAVTPEQPMWMAGYAARKRPAEGKTTELWAKAIVLQDSQEKKAVLVTLDLVGIDRDLGLSIRQKVAEKLGLELSQVMVNTSHTHSGPVVAKNLRPMHYLMLDEAQRKLVDEYAQFLERTVVQLAKTADKQKEPARVTHTSGTCPVAVNRRNNKEPDVPALRDAGKLVGPSDHDVPVLAVHKADGELMAVVFGYACHATVLDGYTWSGDYPGYAQLAIESAHPGAVALFWAGCGGDQNPLPRRKQQLAEKYGRQLADSVEQALGGHRKTVPPSLTTAYRELDLPLGTLPTRDELTAQSRDTNPYVAARAKHYLAELDAGRSLPSSYPYPIGVWRLGDEIDWVFLGGEVVVDYALRLKEQRRGKQTWGAGYSNDVMAYIPSRRVLAEGGYEGGGAMVYYGLPAPWHDTVEAAITEEVQELP